MIALGGVACALGGAAWGASGLAGQPSTHLTISLLMIGNFNIYCHKFKPDATQITFLTFRHVQINFSKTVKEV